MLCDKFSEIWPSKSGEIFFKRWQWVFFSLFRWTLSPIEKKCCLALYLNQNWIPFNKECLGLSLSQWFWRNHFQMLSVCYCYLAFFLWKRRNLLFGQTLLPFLKWYFMPNLVNISQVVQEKMKIIQVYRQVGTRTTGNKKDHKLDLYTKVS